MKRIHVGAGGFLLAALVFYLGTVEEIAALMLPVAVHELGHIAVLRLFGLRITGIRLEAKGLCIQYSGYCGAWGHILTALAGPAAGFLYAWVAALLASRFAYEIFYLSAGISLLLSVFNLLPALPLDGGRVVLMIASAILGDQKGAVLTDRVSVFVGLVLFSAGIVFLLRGRGLALMLAALWVLLHPKSGRGLVKNQELL